MKLTWICDHPVYPVAKEYKNELMLYDGAYSLLFRNGEGIISDSWQFYADEGVYTYQNGQLIFDEFDDEKGECLPAVIRNEKATAFGLNLLTGLLPCEVEDIALVEALKVGFFKKKGVVNFRLGSKYAEAYVALDGVENYKKLFDNLINILMQNNLPAKKLRT